jgi:hypothetical protein
MELNGGRPTWPQFIQLANARFRPPLMDSTIGELAMLQRTRIVDEFSKRFITLSCRDTSLTEAQQIQLFITSLGDPLRTDVALQQPSFLDDAVIFAWAYEQHNASRDIAQPMPTQNYSRPTIKPVAPTPSSLAHGVTGAATPATVMCLTSAVIAHRQKDGKCFHCNDFFVQGHKKQCKQLFVIEVVVEDSNDEQPPDGTEPTISLHALTDIQPHSGRTMQVYIIINDTKLRALLDSGSNHNFVDSEAASRTSTVFGARHSLPVAVASGDRINSFRCCHILKISIANEDFIIDCYGLVLGSYEMVLGVQWLASLGPILWDFEKQSMSFVRNGCTVKWSAPALPSQLDTSVMLATKATSQPPHSAGVGHTTRRCPPLSVRAPLETRTRAPMCCHAHPRGHPLKLLSVLRSCLTRQEDRRLVAVLRRLPVIERQNCPRQVSDPDHRGAAR